MYNEKLIENHLSCAYMIILSQFFFAELKHAHLQYCVFLNAFNSTLSSLNIEFYGWNVRGDYNVVSNWFSEIQIHHMWQIVVKLI